VATLQEGLHAARAGNAELHYQLGVLHAARDEMDEAQTCLSRAIACDPKHVSAHERLAQCCGARGNCPEAFEWLLKAQAIDPANARIAFQLSVLAPQAGPAEAAEACDRMSAMPELDAVRGRAAGRNREPRADSSARFSGCPPATWSAKCSRHGWWCWSGR